jgi:hypothetical protein
LLLDVIARFSPESAGSLGLDGFDEAVSDPSRANRLKARAATGQAARRLRAHLKEEHDQKVQQDLNILIAAADRDVRSSELNDKHHLPYTAAGRFVFRGIRALLDDQVQAHRRRAALVRLRRYTGTDPGYAPFTQRTEKRIRERLRETGILFPYRSQVEQDLGESGIFVEGLGQLFRKYRIDGYEEPLAKLQAQITAYGNFVRKEVLPRSRTDFRLPPELYANALANYGVDLAPEELIKRARAAFTEIQMQMQPIALAVAKERGWSVTDYRDVIRELKKEQLVGEAILPHYRTRLALIEGIVRRERLVTLPERAARIRLATAAESTQTPAPNMRWPRLLGNTGELGEFVLPLNIPDKSGRMQGFDDFTFAAASWTLTAHEARPGHELQFASLVEKGVSTARAVYAANSTNVEGWGLYAEWLLQPHLPPDGQLIGLQHRLVRAARAFLDPELQLGKVTPEEAARLLRQDVVLSDAMARQEVERYTFRSPGQATSYFYGYTRLMELRAEVEKALGPKFVAKDFHDFLLAQGLLPPSLMRQAVLEEFLKRVPD